MLVVYRHGRLNRNIRGIFLHNLSLSLRSNSFELVNVQGVCNCELVLASHMTP